MLLRNGLRLSVVLLLMLSSMLMFPRLGASLLLNMGVVESQRMLLRPLDVSERLHVQALAWKHLKLATEFDPNHKGAFRSLGRMYVLTEHYDLAVRALTRALRIQPGDVLALFWLGHAYKGLGANENAVWAWRNAGAGRWFFFQGAKYLELGLIDNAAAEFASSTQINPDYSESWCQYGFVLEKMGEAVDALTMYSRGVSEDSFDTLQSKARCYYRIGRILLNQKKWESAKTQFEIVLGLEPSYVDAYLRLAEFYYWGRRDSARAQWFLLRAYELDPEREETYLLLGDFGLREKHYADAQRWLEKAIDLFPESFWGHLNLGIVYLSSDSPERAAAEFILAAALKPDDARPHEWLSRVYLEQGKVQESIWESHFALRLNPESALAYAYLGQAYVDMGDRNKALEYLRVAIELDPTSSYAKQLIMELSAER